ncbi:hypothetical protein DdX_18681 [Ditylenchus destructor]|uniref:Uncharacterized protein n=1 Tax=Ditylenchus destructor TaxID=166010 RepID=A0AAD4MJ84_9BILA|nr:hypothetical protein DdX_18681 [Ditylenchus destructor]
MPIVTLTTNIPKSKFPPDFRIEFVKVEACINYTEAENAWAVELMTEFLTVTLDVPAERVIVVFKELQPQNVGLGGKLITQREEMKGRFEKNS